MKITNKLILDIVFALGAFKGGDYIKVRKILEDYGHEVENEKSIVDQCKEHLDKMKLIRCLSATEFNQTVNLSEKAIKELEDQIDKMKRCENCEHEYDNQDKEFCNHCINNSKWELKK